MGRRRPKALTLHWFESIAATFSEALEETPRARVRLVLGLYAFAGSAFSLLFVLLGTWPRVWWSLPALLAILGVGTAVLLLGNPERLVNRVITAAFMPYACFALVFAVQPEHTEGFLGVLMAPLAWTAALFDGATVIASVVLASLVAAQRVEPWVEAPHTLQWLYMTALFAAVGYVIWAKAEKHRRARSALEIARREAEDALQVKSQFIARMSHELRTPMNGVMGLTELVLQTHLEPSQRESLELVQESARNLLRTVNDILDLSKMEVGKLQIVHAPFALAQMLRDTASALSPLAHQRGLTLVAALDPALPAGLDGDAVRLRQVLTNLLGNAVKFTRTGEVKLQATWHPETGLCCVVTDSGPGIDPERIEQMFGAFTQGDDSLTRRADGTGLGLTIARDLVQLMGGTLELKSHAGRGTVATVVVPMTACEPPAVGLATAGSDVANARPLNVLVAEDNAVNAKVAVRMLERLGQRATVAVDGLRALEVMAGDFDLVLMDVQMPELDGLEATRRWRQSEADARHLPIYGCTASAAPADRAACLAAGMDGVLTKPFALSDLGAVLKEVADPLSRRAPVV